MGVDTAAPDRLPWLADEPASRRNRKRGGSGLLPWAAAALVAVGAGGFWMGLHSVRNGAVPSQPRPLPSTSVVLPPARSVASPEVQLPAQPEVRPSPAPVVHPAPSREVRIAVPPRSSDTVETNQAPPAESAAKSSAEPATGAQSATANPSQAAPAVQKPVLPQPWNPRVFDGAAGRVVQIGAFGSVTQAKRGWWFMVRAYPAMSHLPAVVRPTRNSKGRGFYRFQVGTTSQAHSEVLCQRMEKIGFSCAVVGLPWKAKVER